jgi:hypothetical protein
MILAPGNNRNSTGTGWKEAEKSLEPARTSWPVKKNGKFNIEKAYLRDGKIYGCLFLAFKTKKGIFTFFLVHSHALSRLTLFCNI